MKEKLRIPEKDYNELSPLLLGVAAHNSAVGHVSTPRAVMDSNHIAQSQVLLYPDKKEDLISGVEYELGKLIDDIRVETDCTVVGSVQKLPGSPDNPVTCVFTQYEKNGELWFDVIEIPKVKSKHSYFGYTLHPQETLLSLSYGSQLQEGDILATTTSLGPDGFLRYGVNANTVFSSDVATGEDGFVVSRSFLNKLQFEVVETRVINLKMDNFLINLYGDEHVYKVLPNIGEYVKNGELLAVIRERDDYFSIVDLNEDDIRRTDHTFDKKTYVEMGSKVIDIKVFKGTGNKQVYSDNMSEQIEDLFAINLKYAKSVVGQYSMLKREVKKTFGANFTPRLTPRMTKLITDAMTLIKTTETRRKLSYGSTPIDQYRIEITTSTVVKPNIGFKITDLFGGKGTITAIREDDEMPYCPISNARADIIAGGITETISRMNIGRILAGYMGAANRDNRKRLIDHFVNKYGVNYINKINQDDIMFVKDFLHGYYSMINPRMVGYLESFDADQLEDHIYEVLEEALYIEFPVGNEYNLLDVIECIEESSYAPFIGRLNYKQDGIDKVSHDNIRINRLYFMLLDRTGRDFLAVASSKVNNYLIPIKPGGSYKHHHQHSQTPITSLSETESQIIAGYADEMLAEMFDVTLNPSSHRALSKDILETGGKFNTDFDIDRQAIPYGGAMPVKLLRHVFRCAGLEFEYVDDDHLNSNEEIR